MLRNVAAALAAVLAACHSNAECEMAAAHPDCVPGDPFVCPARSGFVCQQLTPHSATYCLIPCTTDGTCGGGIRRAFCVNGFCAAQCYPNGTLDCSAIPYSECVPSPGTNHYICAPRDICF